MSTPHSECWDLVCAGLVHAATDAVSVYVHQVPLCLEDTEDTVSLESSTTSVS